MHEVYRQPEASNDNVLRSIDGGLLKRIATEAMMGGPLGTSSMNFFIVASYLALFHENSLNSHCPLDIAFLLLYRGSVSVVSIGHVLRSHSAILQCIKITSKG